MLFRDRYVLFPLMALFPHCVKHSASGVHTLSDNYKRNSSIRIIFERIFDERLIYPKETKNVGQKILSCYLAALLSR